VKCAFVRDLARRVASGDLDRDPARVARREAVAFSLTSCRWTMAV
jgi:hypothetical protein